MLSQIVFNIDRKVKEKAMRRAKQEGVPFAIYLRQAAEDFAEGKRGMAIVDEVRPEKLALWEMESKLLDKGSGTRLRTMKEYREFVRNL
jgi:hypothetical protein